MCQASTENGVIISIFYTSLFEFRTFAEKFVNQSSVKSSLKRDLSKPLKLEIFLSPYEH